MMRRCIRLARKGGRAVEPNPRVGCVIVGNGRIISEGWHRKFGGPHAEIEALTHAGASARGATLYVSLEPCNHSGKTPPCTRAIVEAGIAEVVIATRDPNPEVRGGGISVLRRAGVSCVVGFEEADAFRLNERFFINSIHRRPYVILKTAQTLDGKISPSPAKRVQITSEKSLKTAHKLRASVDAVVIGAGTLRIDDPMLNVRHAPGPDPIRIVLTSSWDLPSECRLFTTAGTISTLVVGPKIKYPSRKQTALLAILDKMQVEVLQLPQLKDCRISLKHMLHILYKRGIYSILVEGGSNINGTFLHERLFDRIEMFLAPRVFGSGIEAFGPPFDKARGREQLIFASARRSGSDLHLTYHNKMSCPPYVYGNH